MNVAIATFGQFGALNIMDMIPWQWLAFAAMIAVLLGLDLLVFHRRDRAPSLKESALWTVFWCSLAAGFNGLVWWRFGTEAGVAWATGYVIEWSLSMDNVFVFAVIFRYFQVPMHYQYRVLFWGILGAVVLRLVFVLAGTQLIHHFAVVLPLFGLLLIYSGLKLALQAGGEVQPEKNFVLRFARRWLRVTKGDHRQHGHAFFVREDGRFCITPLLLVLLVLESTDVIFAVDSVPAIFGITVDPFIVFTSNIFAILGLRALYFLLAGVIELFEYLHYGLAAVLAFVGTNMMADYFLVKEDSHVIPTWAKLVVVALLLVASIVASLARKGRVTRDEELGSKD
jgi:tellurite resistance protein TerC